MVDRSSSHLAPNLHKLSVSIWTSVIIIPALASRRANISVSLLIVRLIPILFSAIEGLSGSPSMA
jgi:hypothetical protein